MEERISQALRAGPASAASLIERLDPPAPWVFVYGALANLAARGEIEEVARGPGERVWALRGGEDEKAKARDPGLPATFSLSEVQVGDVDKAVGRITAGLPGFYFEELRWAVTARADRSGRLEIEKLGPPKAAARFLRRVERGGRVRLRLSSPFPRWLFGLLVMGIVVALLRLFVLGVYTVPPTSISMAPALMPAAEGGDGLVLANLLAGAPERGDVVLFRLRGAGKTFVKRVMGLEGESIEISDGELFVGGQVLVKERALLERLQVPLPGFDIAKGPHLAEAGYIRPDGSFNRQDLPCREVILSARVTATAAGATLTLILDDGRTVGHTLALGTIKGGVAVRGIEVASGPAFSLTPNRPVDLWLTNADGCFRVELDGREVARARIESPGTRARLELVATDGMEVDDLRLARDLYYTGVEGGHTWRVGQGEVFVLGDNSENSYDSRRLPPIRVDWVLGKVFAVAWPPSRMRRIR